MMQVLGPQARAHLDEVIGSSVSEALLIEALTHPSMSGVKRKGRQGETHPDYNRLEFVGDRVLGLAVSSLIFRQFPDADAGELAIRFNRLVREESLAMIARDIGIGSHIFMAKGERESGGASRPAILADVLEALIAATYLDCGYAAAEAFVLRWFMPHVGRAESDVKDAKTALQEAAAARSLAAPVYSTVEQSGPSHLPSFRVRVEVAGLGSAEATGPSKRAAQQDAARQLLETVRRPS